MAYEASQIRAVRLLIPDTEQVYGDAEDEYIFPDEDIEIYLDQGMGNAKWAAGLASIAVGGSEGLILKVIRNYETATNGAALMKEWTARGARLIDDGRQEVDEETNVGIFEIAFPHWGPNRHPEGYSHGSYRMPTPYQW